MGAGGTRAEGLGASSLSPEDAERQELPEWPAPGPAGCQAGRSGLLPGSFRWLSERTRVCTHGWWPWGVEQGSAP